MSVGRMLLPGELDDRTELYDLAAGPYNKRRYQVPGEWSDPVLEAIELRADIFNLAHLFERSTAPSNRGPKPQAPKPVGVPKFIDLEVAGFVTELLEEWGRRIVAARFEAKMTRIEVASELGTTPATVKKWEKGHTQPPMAYCVKLTRLFGKRLEELFPWDPDAPGNLPEVLDTAVDALRKRPEPQVVDLVADVLEDLAGQLR